MYKIGSQNLISWINSYKIDITKVRIDYYQLNFIFKIEIKNKKFGSCLIPSRLIFILFFPFLFKLFFFWRLFSQVMIYFTALSLFHHHHFGGGDGYNGWKMNRQMVIQQENPIGI